MRRGVARWVRGIRPACSSTFRWRETAGWDTLNGAASSATVASPSASRVKIARLVGSASAPNTRLSRSGPIYNHLVSKLDGYIVASAVPVVNPAPTPMSRSRIGGAVRRGDGAGRAVDGHRAAIGKHPLRGGVAEGHVEDDPRLGVVGLG